LNRKVDQRIDTMQEAMPLCDVYHEHYAQIDEWLTALETDLQVSSDCNACTCTNV